jgi:hypothetical protein
MDAPSFHYARKFQGRVTGPGLCGGADATEADLIPDQQAETLTVRLHHLTNRASDQAARFLAAHLNATETVYPGTNLRLVYKVVSD